MKPARPIVLALLLFVAVAALAGSARAQSIPEVPISTGPNSVAPAAEPAAWGAGAGLPLVPVFTGGTFAPVLPVWLAMWLPSAGERSAARERSSRFVIRERRQVARTGSR